MDVMQAIYSRSSVRRYRAGGVEAAVLDRLIAAAVRAPSAMNAQPWAFGVVQDTSRLSRWSDEIKAMLLKDDFTPPLPQRYRPMLLNPDFNVFHRAPALIVIYARPAGPNPVVDCSLAAQNLMLAAHGEGLGACWIGFAAVYLNRPDVKKTLGVPEECTAVAPIAVGRPEENQSPTQRREAEVLYRV